MWWRARAERRYLIHLVRDLRDVLRFVSLKQEALVATVADLTTQVSLLNTAVADLATKVDALKNQPVVATQADLDALSSGLAGVQSSIDAIRSSLS